MQKPLTILIILSMLLIATPITAISQNPHPTTTQTHTIHLNPNDLEITTIHHYDSINIPNGGIHTQNGKPLIPTKTITIAIPHNLHITTIHTTPTITQLPGTYTLIPSQPPQTLTHHTTEIQHPTTTYYTQTEYPTHWAEISHQNDLAGQNLIHITLYPIHYHPHTKTVTMATTLTLTLIGTNDHTIQEYLPPNLSPPLQTSYHKQLTDMVINPTDINQQTATYQHQSLGVPAGNYDYVIISPTTFANAYQPLQTWKTQKGIPTNITTTDWIYNQGGYSGTNQQKIRAFIQDAHNTWGATYFLLGADEPDIPYETVYYKGDTIPTDTFYADYDDDWIDEVYVGRASVINTGTGAGGISNFISKIMTYEKNPPTSNYAKNIGLFGFDLDSTTDGEDCKQDIDSLYIPSSWTQTKVYDSHTGNHEDNVDTAVNNGQHLINHIDHSSEDYMGTGYTNHNWGLTNSEVDAFNNGDKQSIWYSIGCWAGAFDYSNCIAEHFVRDTDGGGVGFVGNTRYGWYYLGYDDYASLRYDRYFFRSLFNQNHINLGQTFADHKNDAYQSMTANDLNKYIYSELTLFGDPELPIWTENPQTLTVTHPATLPIGTSTFTVQVTDGSSNLADATVCIWKGSEVYDIQTTNSQGQATFNPAPTTTGLMKVTVTTHNFIPYQSNATVVSNNQPPIADAGGPYSGETGTTITLDGSASYDPDGTIVLYEWDFESDGTYDWSSPTTGITTHTYSPAGTYTATLRVTDNDGADDTDTATVTITDPPNNPPYIPSNPTPPHQATDVDFNIDLSWDGGDPDPGDTVTYDIYFGTNSPPPKIYSNHNTTTYDPGTLQYSTTYYWFISAEDNHGEIAVSSIWEFTTEPPQNHPPNPPTNPQPPHQATDITLTPTLTWTGGDPDGDTVTYDIYFGTTTPPPKTESNQTDTTYTPGSLAIDTTYYWQIISWDIHGEYTTGPIWEFTTQPDTNLAPDKPTITGYVKGRAGITYTYSFTTTDPDNDDIYLYIDWGDDTTSGWIGPYTSGEEITMQHTWNTVGSYLIRAKAKDVNDKEGDWGHLSITMPLQTTIIHTFIQQILQRFTTQYPLVTQLLQNLLQK